MSYATLLSYLQKQIEWSVANKSLPLHQIYLTEVIQLNILGLLGGDPALVQKLYNISTTAMDMICTIVEQSGKDLRDSVTDQMRERGLDVPPRSGSGEVPKSTFEDIMKNINIPGINIQGTGFSKDDVNKQLDEQIKDKTKQVDDLKKKIVKKRKKKEPPTQQPEDKTDENKEKDNPSGD
jgi:hypothetical protein